VHEAGLNDWHTASDGTRRSNKVERDRMGMWHRRGRSKFIKGFGGKCLIGGPGHRQEHNIKMDGIERCKVDSSDSE